jgi:type I restriction enzyme S subunit
MTLRVHPEEIVRNSLSPLLSIAPWWERVPLGDIATVVNGAAFLSARFNRAGVGWPLIRIRDVGQEDTQTFYDGDFEDRHVVRPGNLLVGMDGDFRVARWKGPKALLNQRVCRLDVDETLFDSRFLELCVQPYLDAVHAVTSAVTVKHLSSKTIAQLPIPLAPLAEQERIVAAVEEHLSRLDSAASSLIRAERNLRVMRDASIHGLISGTIPAGRDGSSHDARELLAAAADERMRYLSDGGFRLAYNPTSPGADLPTLPEDWVWATIGQVAAQVTVGHVGSVEGRYRHEGVPFLRSQNVRPNRFDQAGLQYIDLDFHKQLAKSRVMPGDVAVVRSGSVGTACVVPDHLGEANCADLVLVKRPVAVDGRWIAFYMNSLGRSRVRAGQVGVALQHFNTKSVAALPIPVPPSSVQQAILDTIEQSESIAIDATNVVGAAGRRADALRRSILAAAFSGNLVEQDPTDEPALELLERIRGAEGQSQRSKPA